MNKNYLSASVFSLFFVLVSCGQGDDPATSAIEKIDNNTPWFQSRVFQDGGATYAPADFQNVNLEIKFDLSKTQATGVVEIEWAANETGLSYFLSGPEITSAELDGESINLISRRDPDNLNNLIVIPSVTAKGEKRRLHLEYKMPEKRVSVRPEGVSFLTSMSDISSGNYLEAYAPANFENDAFKLKMDLKIIGQTARAHSVFANGDIQKMSNNHWSVEFPDYFTASSFYLHLTDTPLTVYTTRHQGLEKTIPITVYSQDAQLADQAIKMLPGLFSELEQTYGPYVHSSFVAYISGRGGMEYCGATITSISALGHELTHSWFARGVMPSDGRSGWIDEAIASWRDYGYTRARQQGTRKPTNLGRVSAFQRFTLPNAYVDGRALLSEFDLYFAGQGGLKPVLRDFFARWKQKNIRTADFQSFLEEKAQANLSLFFEKYVYGADKNFPGDRGLIGDFDENETMHPPALTDEEVEQLR